MLLVGEICINPRSSNALGVLEKEKKKYCCAAGGETLTTILITALGYASGCSNLHRLIWPREAALANEGAFRHLGVRVLF